MKFKSWKFSISIWLILWLIGVNTAWAENQAQTLKSVTLSDIKQHIQSIKDKQNLAEDLKNRILAAYQEAEDNLREIENQKNQAESYKSAVNNFPLENKQLSAQIAELDNDLKDRKPERLSSFPIDELEQRQIIEKTHLSDLDAEIARNEGLRNELTVRPQAIREKSADLKSRLSNSLHEQQLLAGKSNDSLLEREAKQIQLDTRIRLLNNSLKTLELESISNPMRLELQKNRSHLLSLQREHQALLIADLESYLLDKRQQVIDKEQADLLQIQKDAQGKHPFIYEAARDNMLYNRKLKEVNTHIEQYLAEKNDIDARYKQLEKDFQSAEQKINLAGLSPAFGKLLREQRRNLPHRKQYEGLIDTLQNEIAAASLEMFKLDEVKNRLQNMDKTLFARFEQQHAADTDASEVLRIRTELRVLLNEQKDLVGRLSFVYAEYARMLGDVDFTLQQMLISSEKFSLYLDQRLLWVPSAPVITDAFLPNIVASAAWFLSPHDWLIVLDNLLQGVKTKPVFLLAPIIAILGLYLRYRKTLKTKLMVLLSRSGSNQYLVNFSQTLAGLIYIMLLSLPASLLMVWIAAWVIVLAEGNDGFSRALAYGLLHTAVSLVVVQFFYRLFKPEGVAEVFFQWRKSTIRLLYSQLKWGRLVIIPCIFVVAMTGNNFIAEHSSTLGRTAQIIMMMTFSYVLHRLSHPLHGLAKHYYANNQNWLTRLSYLWYAIATLLPWVVIGFAVTGYYQSALELQSKLISTLRVIFATALVHALVLRWLTVTKRQLALQNARQKRKQADQVASNTGGEGHYVPEEVLLDISKINQQSDKLLTTLLSVALAVGAWMIWGDILPAFSIFDRVELWQHSELIDGKESFTPITLSNLLLSLVYASLAGIFVSNFPALVDLFSVGKFAMTAGSRYALIQLVRYTLICIAFLLIANELGGSWSQVQWLVAALGVGLGFGLQEIFANMVSGIILLFERPMRVGDTVTVGDITGRVCRIQMRATHILDLDSKELVVPNKAFITDRLINWTLTDTITRVTLMVGVAYGSDVVLVEQILKDVVNSLDRVLDDPEPMITLLNFGENSLDFRICVHVSELGDRMLVTHEFHKAVYFALQQHHIEIPYPQRDVHIRSVAAGILPA